MLASMLQSGERVLWTGHPDPLSTLRTQLALWWVGVPWMIITLTLHAFGLIAEDWIFLPVVTGGVFLVAPFLLVFQAGGTIYAITDRRAIIKHDALGKHQTVSVPFEDMDDKLEIMETRPGVGHLYFASKMSTKLCCVDFDGKLAFRELGRARETASLLEKIREHWKRQR